jgi:hypothetical protein
MKKENERDKRRFDYLKAEQKKEGSDEETATGEAAHEVKEMRKREGRAKVSKTPKRRK